MFERFDRKEKKEKGVSEKLQEERMVVDYTGSPIDVYLADKHLKIIDTRHIPSLHAEYLLIDPLVVSDVHTMTDGYKGIREGEHFVIGRNNPHRFTLQPTVSRQHCRIGLENGRIIIEDLGSKNGTTVKIKNTESISESTEEKIPDLVVRNSYSYRDGIQNLDRTIDAFSSIEHNTFDPNTIQVLETVTYFKRTACQIIVPGIQEPILFYESIGRGAADVKKKGEWHIIGGWLAQPEAGQIKGWFIKTYESIQLAQWRMAEQSGQKLTYLQQMAKYFEEQGPPFAGRG